MLILAGQSMTTDTNTNIDTDTDIKTTEQTNLSEQQDIPFAHYLEKLDTASQSQLQSNTHTEKHIIESGRDGDNIINVNAGIVPMTHGLALAGLLFVIGLCGVMVRRNLLFMLMSLEVMMNAAALAFVVAGSRWINPDGQVMFIFILTLAAAEAAIGLAILFQFYHRRGHLNVDTASEMRG